MVSMNEVHLQSNQDLVVDKVFVSNKHGELRIAFVATNFQGMKSGYLSDLIVYSGETTKKSNIYKAIVENIEPSLDAVFVNYNGEKSGFLPISKYFNNFAKKSGRVPAVGDEIIVQVEKDERGNKGAALTSYISLAGSYMVLMINNPESGGISKRANENERPILLNILKDLKTPKEHGVIIRTAGIGRSISELQDDLDKLLHDWDEIEKAYHSKPGPFLIRKEDGIISRFLRDSLTSDIKEILVDDKALFDFINRVILSVRPDFAGKITLYDDKIPMFYKHDIEKQVNLAYLRDVGLRSGGRIVIDSTEALVTIDVNSGRNTRESDIKRTALNTNIEAAQEIARQLRLRDLGGLIVVDFIDMDENHRNIVENVFYRAIAIDKAKIRTTKISKFGIMELSRQRKAKALNEKKQIQCSHCGGSGRIATAESIAFTALQSIEAEISQNGMTHLVVQIPIDVATILLNDKKKQITDLEKKYSTKIAVVPNPNLRIPEFKFKKLNQADAVDLSSLIEKQEDDEYAPCLTHKSDLHQINAAALELSDKKDLSAYARKITEGSLVETEKQSFLKRLLNLFKKNRSIATFNAAKEMATILKKENDKNHSCKKKNIQVSVDGDTKDLKNEDKQSVRRSPRKAGSARTMRRSVGRNSRRIKANPKGERKFYNENQSSLDINKPISTTPIVDISKRPIAESDNASFVDEKLISAPQHIDRKPQKESQGLETKDKTHDVKHKKKTDNVDITKDSSTDVVPMETNLAIDNFVEQKPEKKKVKHFTGIRNSRRGPVKQKKDEDQAI